MYQLLTVLNRYYYLKNIDCSGLPEIGPAVSLNTPKDRSL